MKSMIAVILIGSLLPLSSACSSLDVNKALGIPIPRSKMSQNGNTADANMNAGADQDGSEKPDGPEIPADKGEITDSVTAFKATAYPLVSQWCVGCHASIQSPFFASPDLTVAHEAVIISQKVDFKNIEASRLYLRLAKDQHNCPIIGCDAAAAKMKTALESWAEMLAKPPVDNIAQLPTTAGLLFGDAKDELVTGSNPDGVLLLEASSFILKAPMQANDVPAIAGGKVVGTAAGAGSVTNIQTATTSSTLGTATARFTVKVAGIYRIQGLVNGAAQNNASFYLRVDGGALSPWLFTANGADFTWSTATPTATGAITQITLAAGDHTLEIRQRQAAAKFARVVLSSVNGFDPAEAQPERRQVKRLTFDLSEVVDAAGVLLTFEVSDFSQNAYLFKNPTLVVPSGSVRIKDLRLLINDTFSPQNATYRLVDDTVFAPGKVLSKAALVVLKDKGVTLDQFAVAFGTLSHN